MALLRLYTYNDLEIAIAQALREVDSVLHTHQRHMHEDPS